MLSLSRSAYVQEETNQSVGTKVQNKQKDVKLSPASKPRVNDAHSLVRSIPCAPRRKTTLNFCNPHFASKWPNPASLLPFSLSNSIRASPSCSAPVSLLVFASVSLLVYAPSLTTAYLPEALCRVQSFSVCSSSQTYQEARPPR
eukprot:6199410-Pleurochrysis_carterae.AAC.1